MKASELIDLTDDVLLKKYNDAREELMKLRFQQASGQLTDTSRLRQVRRDIARMRMLLDDRKRKQMMEGEK